VNAYEILVREVDRHHVFVVCGLFREGICQTRHAPVAHADIQVPALCKACGNVFGIGLAFHPVRHATDALGRAISMLAVGRLAANFHELRVVDISAESFLYRQGRWYYLHGRPSGARAAQPEDRPWVIELETDRV
jgi:hypothetical protein